MKIYEQKIEKFLKERGWDNLRPGDFSKSISIEAAELLELFQWDNPALPEVKKDKGRIKDIQEELADVLIYCLQMGTLLKIDLGRAILTKLEKAKQKYPARLVRETHGKDPGRDSAYLQIKRAHRMKTGK